MPQITDDNELRSEEVQDIMSRVPKWVIRRGSVVIVIVFIIFTSVSYFVKYPTIISGSIKITTQNQPIKVVNKIAGKIEKLYFHETDTVNQGDGLALIENSTPGESVTFLRDQIPYIYKFLGGGQSSQIPNLDTKLSFGDIQMEYNNLAKQVREYHHFRNDDYYLSKIKNLNQQVDHYKNLQGITKKQIELAEKEFANTEEQYRIDKKMMREEVISKSDFIKQENDYLRKGQELENIRKYHEQIRITEIDYIKQSADIKFEFEQREREYKESINQSLKLIESYVANWQRNFLLEAPIKGNAFFLKNISEKQHLSSNEEVFVVVPSDQKYLCIMSVPTFGFGKIKEGQKVRIKLDNYPYQEFGQLIGKVKFMTNLPSQMNVLGNKDSDSEIKYRVLVELSDFKTSYNKAISFTPEMSGTGEVVTADMSLLERFFYQIRGGMDN